MEECFKYKQNNIVIIIIMNYLNEMCRDVIDAREENWLNNNLFVEVC
jgi:hypothetical protein